MAHIATHLNAEIITMVRVYVALEINSPSPLLPTGKSPEVTLSGWLGYKPTINNLLGFWFLSLSRIVTRDVKLIEETDCRRVT